MPRPLARLRLPCTAPPVLQAQLRESQRAVVELRAEVARAHAAAEEAAAEASARTVDATNAGQLAVAAEQTAERARAREQEAVGRMHAAEAARQQVRSQGAAGAGGGRG